MEEPDNQVIKEFQSTHDKEDSTKGTDAETIVFLCNECYNKKKEKPTKTSATIID